MGSPSEAAKFVVGKLTKEVSTVTVLYSQMCMCVYVVVVWLLHACLNQVFPGLISET